MNSEHVEVLRHMKETIKAIMPSEVAALDAAIASLSAQQSGEWVLVPREKLEQVADGIFSRHHSAKENKDAYDVGYFGAMLRDAERYRALVASGKFAPSFNSGWALATGTYRATKDELDAAADALAAQQGGRSDD